MSTGLFATSEAGDAEARIQAIAERTTASKPPQQTVSRGNTSLSAQAAKRVAFLCNYCKKYHLDNSLRASSNTSVDRRGVKLFLLQSAKPPLPEAV